MIFTNNRYFYDNIPQTNKILRYSSLHIFNGKNLVMILHPFLIKHMRMTTTTTATVKMKMTKKSTLISRASIFPHFPEARQYKQTKP